MWDATGRMCENGTYTYLRFVCVYGLSRSFFLVGAYSIGVDLALSQVGDHLPVTVKTTLSE
jgi:hypothetical protein